jgi:hypothetical protein
MAVSMKSSDRCSGSSFARPPNLLAEQEYGEGEPKYELKVDTEVEPGEGIEDITKRLLDKVDVEAGPIISSISCF